MNRLMNRNQNRRVANTEHRPPPPSPFPASPAAAELAGAAPLSSAKNASPSSPTLRVATSGPAPSGSSRNPRFRTPAPSSTYRWFTALAVTRALLSASPSTPVWPRLFPP